MPPDPNDLSHIHEPVLVEEVLAHLVTPGLRAGGGLLVDGTVGGGGHAAALLDAVPDLQVLGLDRDPAALAAATGNLRRFGERVRLLHASFADLEQVLERLGAPAPAGVLLDLGLSSLQIDDPGRGFSFRAGDVAPDMRFDPTSDDPDASTLLDRASERDLARWLREYGEEPRAAAVARAIVRARPIRSVEHLRAVVNRAALRVRRHDPATRTFQALRIAVNDEFGHVERGLRAALRCLAAAGRLVVLCFHSGEERLVKAAFREAVAQERGRVLTRKPVRATSEEVRRNPRARPARLRAFAVRE